MKITKLNRINFRKRNFYSHVSIFVISLAFLTSCASKQDVVYFQNTGDFETLVSENTFSPKFKVDDVLSIYVSSLDSEASAPFNLFRGSMGPSALGVDTRLGTGGNSSRTEQVDYLVDKDGEIDFPVIGKIKVAGLTSEELRVSLRDALSEYLKDPIINIRLQNFTITVLGEVRSPGTYAVNGERITIMEALGLANDMTIKGKRENVLVIRDFDGTKVYHRINLKRKEAMSSPVYYLTQNDVVYVEPNKSAITASSLDNRATIAVSIISVLITSTVIFITRN